MKVLLKILNRFRTGAKILPPGEYTVKLKDVSISGDTLTITGDLVDE